MNQTEVKMEEYYRERPISQRPNILWVMLDHVTFRHYKMTKGARPVLGTYERLCREGTEFLNCHSVHPLCLPARASMLTGVYANHHGKLDNEAYPDVGLPFYTDYLRKLGYRVGHFGKNHSGYENFPEKGIEGFYPYSYGNPYKTPEYQAYLDKHGYGHPIYRQEWAMITGQTLHENGDYDLTCTNNFNMYSAGYIKGTEPVHEADFLTDLALEWMESAAAEGRPFAVRVDTWGPHHAYQVPEEMKELLNAEDIEQYPTFGEPPEQKAEMVRFFYDRIHKNNPLHTWQDWQHLMKRAYEHYSYIDKAIGRMLDRLEEKGLAQNTIVIYTADHGDALGSHGGLVDKAGDLMEEVMHIPMVIRWPGTRGGRKCDKLVCNLDLVPTVLDAAGLTPPSYMDGCSLAPLIQGTCGTWREELMAEHYGHFGIHAPQRALYWENYKYIANDGDVHEMYDLAADPFERHNLMDAPEMQHVVKELRCRLLNCMDRFGDRSQDVADIRRTAADA